MRYTAYPAGPTVANTYLISGTRKSVVETMAASIRCETRSAVIRETAHDPTLARSRTYIRSIATSAYWDRARKLLLQSIEEKVQD